MPLARSRRPHAALERWFRERPLLRDGYAAACERFGSLPGVAGVGVGMKFLEKAGRYAAAPRGTQGLCVKVFVTEKKAAVPRNERIPKWIYVTGSGGARRRVLLDVVTTGQPSWGDLGPAESQSGRGWPSAGSVLPGRLFSFGVDPVDTGAGSFPASGSGVRIGTTGALLKDPEDRFFAVSAGHVFTDPCGGLFDRPAGRRALGTWGRSWVAVDEDAFVPLTIRPHDDIYDGMLFEVPFAFHPPAVPWPDLFLKELARPEDVDAAQHSTVATGFVWVERPDRERPRGIPVDLEGIVPVLDAEVQCGDAIRPLSYGAVCVFRFTTAATTQAGDSGAPVFIRAADGSGYRLLALHFLEWRDKSYAVDARYLFAEILRKIPGADLGFA